MPIRSSYGPAAVATGPATAFTTVATERAEIATINVTNVTGSAATLTVSIGADATGTRIINAYSVPASGTTGSTKTFYGPFDVAPGTAVQLSSGTNNALTIKITYDRQLA